MFRTRSIFARSGTLYRVIFTMAWPHNTREILLTSRIRTAVRIRRAPVRIFSRCAPMHSRATGVGYQNTQAPVLPTMCRSRFGDSGGTLEAGDGNGPVSLASTSIHPAAGRHAPDSIALVTSNVAAVVNRVANQPGVEPRSHPSNQSELRGTSQLSTIGPSMRLVHLF